jgi:hypothetical protein
MRNPLRPSLLPIALALCSTLSSAQLDQAAKKADEALERDSSALSNEKIIAGLKEALQVGAAKAIALTGKHDGFLKNEDIRILLPPKVQALGKGMRLLGQGEKVDDLEIGMNRAAEQATPQAKPIFLAALKKMTFDDARRILGGNETAATDYFRRTSSSDLAAAFTPIVHRSLEHVGVVRQYDSVIKEAPGGSVLAGEFDLDKYVVDKTLDGLFLVLGVEESKIRKNPTAQTTELLREVFGAK